MPALRHKYFDSISETQVNPSQPTEFGQKCSCCGGGSTEHAQIVVAWPCSSSASFIAASSAAVVCLVFSVCSSGKRWPCQPGAQDPVWRGFWPCATKPSPMRRPTNSIAPMLSIGRVQHDASQVGCHSLLGPRSIQHCARVARHTGAGGDNGIAKMWNCREISVSSYGDQSHYLHPPPHLAAGTAPRRSLLGPRGELPVLHREVQLTLHLHMHACACACRFSPHNF
jgi:hypothetical protein